ncbi:MAG: hypothetical protein DYH18_00210 [Xanthomonadales bacterium PRO7]|nr:hypothetical protein [Xanthomonadales bacterium PRO7]
MVEPSMKRLFRPIPLLVACVLLPQAHADILIGSFSGDINVRRPILSFADAANGDTAPLRVMGGATSGLIEPVAGVYEGDENVIYVADFRGQSISVFSASSTNGDPAPLRAIGPTYVSQARSVAVDTAHDELFIVSSCCFKVFDRNASGDVSFKRFVQWGGLSGSVTQQNFPTSIVYMPATDEVAETDTDSASPYTPKVLVFNRTDSGNAAPKRVIKGASTLLGNYAGALAYDAPSRKLFVGAYTTNPDNSHSARIVVFDDMANGNVVPLRTIAGSLTGLELAATSSIGGVAIDPERQRLIVSISDYATAANGKLLVFSLSANGNVAPLQTIAGPQASFQTSLGTPIWMLSDRIFRNGFQ